MHIHGYNSSLEYNSALLSLVLAVIFYRWSMQRRMLGTAAIPLNLV